MRNTKKAFTLVELIVVITILAILATIAFISIQGFSADARDGKRSTDLTSVGTQVTIQVTKGVALTSLASSGTANLSGATIGGTGVTVGTNYVAGEPNYTALGMKTSDFQDPQDVNYKMGVTTKKGGKYELATSLENGSGDDSALIVGDYVARGTDTYSGTFSAGIFTLSDDNDIGRFFVGDTVSTNNSETGSITDISDNGLNITTDLTTSTGTNLKITEAESAGLIEAGSDGTSTLTDGNGNAVVDGSTTLLPY